MNSRIVDMLATAAARIEEVACPHAVLLESFPRSIQMDYHSCGVHCILSILRFYQMGILFKRLKKLLRTDEHGIAVPDIKRVLEGFGLECRTLRKPKLRDLKASIDKGCPVLVSLFGGEHYGVVFGTSTDHIFVMNPSIDLSSDGVGSVHTAVRKDLFRRQWDRWGIVVNRPR
jgi:ABC-type bacteriocin/lantibiotic exporter with double-glycine peptidase domain